MEIDGVSFYSTEGPICPYCGHQHRADEAVYYDDDTVALDCEHCDRKFPVEVHKSVSWRTKPA